MVRCPEHILSPAKADLELRAKVGGSSFVMGAKELVDDRCIGCMTREVAAKAIARGRLSLPQDIIFATDGTREGVVAGFRHWQARAAGSAREGGKEVEQEAASVQER
mmetsp:Transcript_25380/g.57177  ORF Transcript_25380/g.57177 Transcript_25380/m.57177 type:complete len:107 (+) Transcript_25380:1761-2081(+)